MWRGMEGLTFVARDCAIVAYLVRRAISTYNLQSML